MTMQSHWNAALETAAQPSDGASWQQELAEALEHAVRPHVAGVFLCPLGNVLEASYSVAPRQHEDLAEKLVKQFLPRMYRSGLETPWELFSPDANEAPRARVLLRRKLLEPSGFVDLTGAFVRSQGGMVAGWLAVFSRCSLGDARGPLLIQLSEVGRAVERSARKAMALAALMGATYPQTTPTPLSRREHQIARLAVRGLSDLNIACQVGISEGTVGRHLHSAYRKLGIGSRLELLRLLGARGPM